MTKHIPISEILDSPQNLLQNFESKGLAPVICYEPWFPRALESIKQSINDGIPVLVRLHSAASYPILTDERYVIDLEAHAVLIVGYDDDKHAVEIQDPWNKEWGGVYEGRRWLSYSLLQIMAVNCTCDKQANLAPLDVIANHKFDQSGELSFNVQIGFYVPRGTVMDRTSWAITQLTIGCIPPDAWESKSINYVVSGCWHVGEYFKVSFPVSNNLLCDGEVQLNVKAVIEGNRPYKFIDQVEICKKIKINSSQVRVGTTLTSATG